MSVRFLIDSKLVDFISNTSVPSKKILWFLSTDLICSGTFYAKISKCSLMWFHDVRSVKLLLIKVFVTIFYKKYVWLPSILFLIMYLVQS